MRSFSRFVAFLIVLALLAVRVDAIETAGELFVDLDASTYTTGDPIWANAGTSSDFGVIGEPIGGFVETTPAIWLDGIDDAFASEKDAPDGISKLNPTSTVEAWVLNSVVDSEETVVAWSEREGPDGTNMSFNYGTNRDFGALGHWGDDFDLGWNGTPRANKWHHLAYTHDGSTARIYVDGTLNNEKDVVGLDPYDQFIAVGGQWSSGGGENLQKLGSLAIGRLRIHDEVLTNEQILANYQEEESFFVSPPPAAPEVLPVAPVHRYDFGNVSGPAENTTVIDLVGDANGHVLGEGATYTGFQLELKGGTSDVAPYVDLPNGMFSSLTDATIETWVIVTDAANTPRFFSFGSSVIGEVEELGGEGADLDVLTLSVSRGDNLGRQNVAIKNLDPAFGGSAAGDVGVQESLNTTVQTPLGSEIHIALVYDSDGGTDGGPALLHYRDGELVTTHDVSIALGHLNDVNNWIGRSNNLGENNFQGSFNEFRIYDYALSINQISGNILSGPDTVNVSTAILGDYNDNGLLDSEDIDLLSAAVENGSMDSIYDLNKDGSVTEDDRIFWIEDATVSFSYVGDANLDGEFNSGDFVRVFTAAKYETGEPAGWNEGDFNGDARFNSGDFVLAFTKNGYEVGPRVAIAAVPEPRSVLLLIVGFVALITRHRH